MLKVSVKIFILGILISRNWKECSADYCANNMNNATLKTVDVERYLGVIINKNENYSKVFNGSKKKRIVLGLIKRNIKCKNAAIIMRLYKSLVQPTLWPGSTFLGPVLLK